MLLNHPWRRQAPLQAAKIRPIQFVPHFHAPSVANLGRSPAPMLHVAIDKGQVGTLAVPIRRGVNPLIVIPRILRWVDSKGGVGNAIFVGVDETKNLRG